MNDLKFVYAVKHKDEAVRASSRSGGIFTAISDRVLDENGVVYGCVMKDAFTAVHVRAETKEARDRMRGSKYIQSNTLCTFSQCAEDLRNGIRVLYTGTPCQIYGLICYLDALNIDRTGLITVDIVCHSTASPFIWKSYVDFVSGGNTPDYVCFRDKNKFGWADHKETICVNGEEKSGSMFADLFYKDLPFPPHCFSCRFKSNERFSDITIGDYWHIGELDNEFNDNKGVSLVITNTKKGDDMFASVSSDLVVKSFPLCLSMQRPFESNYAMPAKRKEFFADAHNMDFGALHEKYTAPSPPSALRRCIDVVLKYWKKVMSIGR